MSQWTLKCSACGKESCTTRYPKNGHLPGRIHLTNSNFLPTASPSCVLTAENQPLTNVTILGIVRFQPGRMNSRNFPEPRFKVTLVLGDHHGNRESLERIARIKTTLARRH